MKIIILGGSGFIGSGLANWLIEHTEHKVLAVDNYSTGTNDNFKEIIRNERFTWIVGDATDESHMELIFQNWEPDVCYNMSAYAAEGRSNYIRNFIHRNNTLGNSNIINQCVNYNCKLIFASSVAVYSGSPPFNENMQPNPIDEYGLSKWTSERSIQIAGETQGLDWCIIRPRNVYGERQSLWDEARNVLAIWMYQIRNSLPMTIFGNGNHTRCFTYIGDILQPLYKAIYVDKEIINLGSPMPYSILEANIILQGVSGYYKVEFLEPRHEVQDAVCSTLNSEVLLGYKHKTILMEGLEKMWDWAKNIPMKERQTPPPLEVNINRHSSIK